MSGKGKWEFRSHCPVCGRGDCHTIGILNIRWYDIGDEKITLPKEGIPIDKCRRCGIVFKKYLPEKGFSQHMFLTLGNHAWDGSHDFSGERDFLIRLFGAKNYELLDVGAGKGGLLRAISGRCARASALDVADFGAQAFVSAGGEFIENWLDGSEVVWSGEPYDVVMCLDVLEHLYSAQAAFENLRKLVRPGGIVVIETGDVDSLTHERDVLSWWYAKLFEHHMFWSAPSLNFVARRYGFSIESYDRVRHKTWAIAGPREITAQVVKMLVHRASPQIYRSFVRRLGVSFAAQPRSPFAKDHIRVVLKKT